MSKKVIKTPYFGRVISSLEDVSKQLMHLDAVISQNDGEVTEEIEEDVQAYIQNREHLGEILLELQQMYMFKMQQVETQDYLAGVIATKKNRLQTQAEYYKNLMIATVKRFGNNAKTPKGLDKYWYETDLFKFNVSPKQSVEITDENYIDERFISRDIIVKNLPKETYEKLLGAIQKNPITFPEYDDKEKISKTKIKEAFDAGEDVDGAELKTNYSIRLHIRL